MLASASIFTSNFVLTSPVTRTPAFMRFSRVTSYLHPEDSAVSGTRRQHITSAPVPLAMAQTLESVLGSFSADILEFLANSRSRSGRVHVPHLIAQDAKLARETLPGSLLRLTDGSVRHIPLTGGVRSTQDGAVQLKVAALGQSSGQFFDVQALAKTITHMVLACLSEQGYEGPPGVKVNGQTRRRSPSGAQRSRSRDPPGRLPRRRGNAEDGNSMLKLCKAALGRGAPKATVLSPDEAIARASLEWVEWSIADASVHDSQSNCPH